MTLARFLRDGHTHYPEKSALIFGEKAWTYAEVDTLTDRLAANLLTQGLKPGDRVAFHMGNCPELVFVTYGCFKAGAIVVPINERMGPSEIENFLQHSEARFYIGQSDLYQPVLSIRPHLPELHRCYVTGDSQLPEAGAFGDLLAAPSGTIELPTVEPGQVAAILYTSGTTAHPKGVTHTHKTLHYMTGRLEQMGMSRDGVAVVLTPMSHMGGFLHVMISALTVGATLVLPTGSNPQTILQTLERHQCTFTGTLPVQCQALVACQEATPYDVSREMRFYSGGDSVSTALQEQFTQAFSLPLLEILGMTESPVHTWNPPGKVRTGSIGVPLDGILLRVVDGDGNEVKLGDVGELTVKSPGTTIGYWNNPEATAETLRDGWLYTGDLVRQDAEGYYWFAGRKKELIIRGGSNISPQEVEAVLYQHPAVAEAGVIGIPDETWGEVVVAYVARKEGVSATEAELIEFAKEQAAAHKVPEKVVFLPSLPKNAVGKVQRRALKEHYRSAHA
jgi:long-chain acyl-CoA synthetase